MKKFITKSLLILTAFTFTTPLAFAENLYPYEENLPTRMECRTLEGDVELTITKPGRGYGKATVLDSGIETDYPHIWVLRKSGGVISANYPVSAKPVLLVQAFESVLVGKLGEVKADIYPGPRAGACFLFND